MKLAFVIWLLIESILFNLLVPRSTKAQTEAQIVQDTTLPKNSVITNQDNIIQIDEGTRAGENLFHSFEKFSVSSGQTAFFNNAVDIQNIFSRVTGDSVSEINGIIKVNGTANLFFVNPNGIIFGSDASLNINGSFIASTANSIIFGDGFVFSTTPNQTEPLLTVTAPIGLGFGKTPGSITNLSVVTDSTGEDLIGLRVPSEQTLALVGGDIFIEGGFLSTEGGRIELGSVAGNNTVSLTRLKQGWALGYERIGNFRDISLSKAALVASSGDSSGDIQIQGKRVSLTEGSQVFVVALTKGQAGNLTVRATELVHLEGNSADAGFNFSEPTKLENDVYKKATGEGSKLTVETQRLTLKKGAQILARTFGDGQGVDLKVNASEVELEGAFIGDPIIPTGLLARVRENAKGTGGSLTIETKNLIVKDGAQVSTETLGSGRGGDLVVNASESIELIGTIPGTNNPSALFAGVGQKPTATGHGGNLNIDTGRLTIRNGAQIGTTAQNKGQGGILTINASSILLTGTSPLAEFRGEGRSGIFVSAEPPCSECKDELGNPIVTTANAGNLNLTTRELTIEKGALISADNFGTGEGASVSLNVNRLILLDGGQIGAGSLLEKGFVNNERGLGGTLTINNAESVDVIGTGEIGSTLVKSSLFTLAEGTGNAGDLNIFTPYLTVRDGGEVNVSATGSGEAGDLQIKADSIHLARGTLTAATASGEGGDIKLQVDNLLLLRNNSLISAEARGNAKGGNIIFNDPSNPKGFVIAVPFENNDIIANTFEGEGGFIQINAQGIFGIEQREKLTPLSDITAFSQKNPELNGVVEINTPEIDPSEALAELPNVPVTVEVAQGCQAEGKQASVEFFNTGKGGLAPTPYEPLSSSNIWEDIPPSTQETANSANEKSTSTSPDKIIEAQGWQIDEKGGITLVAEVPNNLSQSRCRLQ